MLLIVEVMMPRLLLTYTKKGKAPKSEITAASDGIPVTVIDCSNYQFLVDVAKRNVSKLERRLPDWACLELGTHTLTGFVRPKK
jgi:hypothetical protein